MLPSLLDWREEAQDVKQKTDNQRQFYSIHTLGFQYQKHSVQLSLQVYRLFIRFLRVIYPHLFFCLIQMNLRSI